MGDWIQENAAQVLAATVALLVAAVSVMTAEGGRRRRELKRIREELETLALVDAALERRSMKGLDLVELTGLASDLQRSVSGRLGVYLLSSWRRTLMWAERAGSVIFVAGVAWALIDLTAAVFGEQQISGFTVTVLSGLLLAGGIVLSAVAGVATVRNMRALRRDIERRRQEAPAAED